MRPRARISLWAIVIPVALLLVAYLVFAALTYRAPIPSSVPAPSPTATLQPTATPQPATATARVKSQSVTGAWSGTLNQQGGQPGSFSTYTFSMTLTEAAGGAVSGTARAEVANQPQLFIAELITGQVSGSTFTFQKGNVLQSNPPAQAWCIDSGQLNLSPDGTSLNGTWTDGGCGSGTIMLTRGTAGTSAPLASSGLVVRHDEGTGKIGRFPAGNRPIYPAPSSDPSRGALGSSEPWGSPDCPAPAPLAGRRGAARSRVRA